MKKIIFGSFLALTLSASAFAKTSEVKSVNLQEATSVNFMSISKTEAQTFVGNDGQTYKLYSNEDDGKWYCKLLGDAAAFGAEKLGASPAVAAAAGAAIEAGCNAIFTKKVVPVLAPPPPPPVDSSLSGQ